MPLRQGEKVITVEGYFVKILGLSGGAGEDPLLLGLEVTGIGLRAGVPASHVTALGTVLVTPNLRAVAAIRACIGRRCGSSDDGFSGLPAAWHRAAGGGQSQRLKSFEARLTAAKATVTQHSAETATFKDQLILEGGSFRSEPEELSFRLSFSMVPSRTR
jgi:hypothetical protein